MRNALFAGSPDFLLTAVLSLALGIGATASIFTALDAAVWKPLSVSASDNLVRLTVFRRNHGDKGPLPGEFAPDLRESKVFSDIVAFSSDGLASATAAVPNGSRERSCHPISSSSSGSSRYWDKDLHRMSAPGAGRRKRLSPIDLAWSVSAASRTLSNRKGNSHQHLSVHNCRCVGLRRSTVGD